MIENEIDENDKGLGKRIKSLRYGKLDRRKFVVILLIILILIVAFLSYGGSITNPFSTTGGAIELQENPEQLELPNIGDGGVNLTGDFDIGENFTIPDDFLTDNPFTDIDLINGSLPDIEFPDIQFPNVSFPEISIPSIDPPTLPDPDIPTSNPNITTPTITNTNGTGLNFTLPERDNKARNLPEIKPFNISFGEIELPSIPVLNLNIRITVEGLVFISILLLTLVLNKKFIPDIIRKLEEGGDSDGEEPVVANYFITGPKIKEDKKKIERLKRLIVFRDHVNELIKKSKSRLEAMGSEETIITGYHELDQAFAAFSKLIRSKDLTPLEHARLNFITGEIDNYRLEEIVNLFYITRFGHKELTNKDGEQFIMHLMHLVISKEILELDEGEDIEEEESE